MSMTLRDLREEAVACDPELQRVAREPSQLRCATSGNSTIPTLPVSNTFSLEAGSSRKRNCT